MILDYKGMLNLAAKRQAPPAQQCEIALPAVAMPSWWETLHWYQCPNEAKFRVLWGCPEGHDAPEVLCPGSLNDAYLDTMSCQHCGQGSWIIVAEPLPETSA